jgi:porin
MKHRRALVAVSLVACSAHAPQSFGEEISPGAHDLRAGLRERGFDFGVSYVSETATNVHGGSEQLYRYTDQWAFSAQLDLEKLLAAKNARFTVVITDRNGRNLSDDAHLGSLQQVQEVYGRGQTWRWTEFYYDQQYLNGTLDWKIGRLPVGDDFASFSCDFMNLTFCGSDPGNIVGDYWYNWPVSQWATRLKVKIHGFGYVQFAAYEVNPNYLLDSNGMRLDSPGSTAGVLAPFEIGWLPTFGGLAGSYKFGGWYSSGDAPDVVQNQAGDLRALSGGEPLMHKGQSGAYLNFEQRLTAPQGTESRRGMSVFLNAVYADDSTSTLDLQIAAGLTWTGPFRRRPVDLLGFALGETHINSRIQDARAQQNAAGLGRVGVPSSERVGELFYTVRVGGRVDLRPNVQYVSRAGGLASNERQLIAGLKVLFTL